jgi:hypothetical protein
MISERLVPSMYNEGDADAKASANIGVHPARGRTATVLQPGRYKLVRSGQTLVGKP